MHAILRVQKLKSAVAVHRSMKHAFREQDTPNAARELAHENDHIGASNVAEAMQKFRGRLPEKFRKDAVQCVEYLITGSPEGMHAKSKGDQDRYFQDGLAWLKEKHGAENVIYAGIHRDESTPHMYAYVVPRVGEKLNCRAFLGGSKALSDMQTDFALKVGQVHGLERGIKGSKATHQRVSQFYARINDLARTPHIAAEDLEPREFKREGVLEVLRLTTRVEGPELIAKRLNNEVRESYAPTLEKAAAFDLATKKAKESEKTAKYLFQQAKPLLDASIGLSLANQEKLASLLKVASEKLLNEQRETNAKNLLARKRERKNISRGL